MHATEAVPLLNADFFDEKGISKVNNPQQIQQAQQ